MKTWFIAIVALILGAAIAYTYKQVEVNNLTTQLSVLETKVADATGNANSAATEADDLKAELEAKSKLADELQAKISALEAALRMNEATSLTSATQPTPPSPTSPPAPPTTPPAPQ